MGTAERKEREWKEMRTKIMDAAREMFVAEGFEKTSMRKIAKEIEYSPAAMYRYFANKDELFYAIHAEVFDLMYAHLQPIEQVEHPVERLRQLGHRYLDFALKNPEYYELLFVQHSPMKTDMTEEEWVCAMKTFTLLDTTVKECIEKGYFSQKNQYATTFLAWSSMHGMVTLLIRNRLKMYPEEYREDLIRQTSDMMIEQLQK